ncbi:MAG: hypothetical protein ACP5SH_15315 [Syntrophobacteraceae bacterium]
MSKKLILGLAFALFLVAGFFSTSAQAQCAYCPTSIQQVPCSYWNLPLDMTPPTSHTPSHQAWVKNSPGW